MTSMTSAVNSGYKAAWSIPNGRCPPTQMAANPARSSLPAKTRSAIAPDTHPAQALWSLTTLSIGPNEVSVGKDALQAFSPSLYHYVSHLHIAVSGFIAATGLAVLFLVAFGVRRGQLWAWVGAVAAPMLGLAVALPAHYPNHFDTLGHLGLIYLAVVIFVAGALLALQGILAQRRG
jgi:hypothetical protein